MTPLRTRLAASALGAGLVIGAPTAGWATSHRPVDGGPKTTATTAAADTTAKADTTASVPAKWDLESLRTRCVAAIDARLPRLSAAKAALASARRLTDAHRAALTGLVDDARAGLQTLRMEIQADTEVDALVEHCRSIFADYRVFPLLLPRARLVIAADVSVAAADKLDDVAGKLGAAIAQAEAAGRDMAQAKADLEAMKGKVASGRTSAAAAADAVLGDGLAATRLLLAGLVAAAVLTVIGHVVAIVTSSKLR
jgi:hypothetical protein